MPKKLSLSDLSSFNPFGNWKFEQFIDNLTDKGLYYTVMFIKNGTNGPYGEYRFPSEWKKVARKMQGALDEIEYLETYRLDLENDINLEHFSICKIWAQRNEGIDCTLLQPVPFQKYFIDQPFADIPLPSAQDFRNKEQTAKNFKLAEAVLVKALLDNIDPDTSFYLPIPLVKKQEIKKMVYAVYDLDQVTDKEVKSRLGEYLKKICE